MTSTSSLSDFGSTPGEQRTTLRSCLDNMAYRRDAMINYYDEMGWNHGSKEVTRPLPDEEDIAHYENLLRRVSWKS